ncbi:MAG: hypothetical protein PHV30_06015 [Candidatus Margulisbacteria bacterium]|nr:hypothetical protein [Candidatus Margulisiibacteriota bacterium]
MVGLSNILNSLGLILDIVGACMIFKFGLPENINKEGHSHLILEQIDEKEKKKAQNYDSFSVVGLSLLIFGFLLQLISNFI